MNAQETVNQSAEQAHQLIAGSQLITAFKTDAGRVIENALAQGIVDHVDAILWEKMTDEEVLRRVYQIRGILGACDVMGDSMKLAIKAVSRNAISQKLRGRPHLQEE